MAPRNKRAQKAEAELKELEAVNARFTQKEQQVGNLEEEAEEESDDGGDDDVDQPIKQKQSAFAAFAQNVRLFSLSQMAVANDGIIGE